MRTITNSTREKIALEPTVLLLHCFSKSGLTWLHTAKELKRDHDVIMIDAGGYSSSEGIAKGYSSELLVACAAVL